MTVTEDNQALDKTFQYVYNGIGNITSVKTYAYIAPEEELSGSYTTTALSYGNSSNPDYLTKCGYKNIGYNAIGYPVTYGSTHFDWSNGKLTKYYEEEDPDGFSSSESTEFTYNAFGNRVRKEYSYYPGVDYSGDFIIGKEVNYDYDHSGKLIREISTEYFTESASVTTELVFLYDESGMIGFTYSLNGASPTSYYYQRNLQGDVVAIYNTSGVKVANYTYDAFGNCTASGSMAQINPIRYRGYYWDSETKWYYLNARYYSPEWRRFISPDDTSYLNSENVNGLNLYCYCCNDPINFVDPSGNLPQWAEWLIGGAVIGLAALGAIFLPGAWGVIAGAAFYGAVTSALGGAVLGGVIGGITGGWEGVLDGAANGFMWGAISGAVSGALTSGINIATGHLEIVGSAQKTGSLFHQFASNVQAGKMSLAVVRYSEIHLNKSKGLNIKGFRPDVTGVTKNGLRVVEVVSTSQTYASQVAKIGRMIGKYSHIINGLTLDELHLITSWFIF